MIGILDILHFLQNQIDQIELSSPQLTVDSCPPNSDSKSSSIIPSEDIVPLITPRVVLEVEALPLLNASKYQISRLNETPAMKNTKRSVKRYLPPPIFSSSLKSESTC